MATDEDVWPCDVTYRRWEQFYSYNKQNNNNHKFWESLDLHNTVRAEITILETVLGEYLKLYLIILIVALNMCSWNMRSLRSGLHYLQLLASQYDIIVAQEHRVVESGSLWSWLGIFI